MEQLGDLRMELAKAHMAGLLEDAKAQKVSRSAPRNRVTVRALIAALTSWLR